MRAFLWQNGVMTDLNTLIPTDSPFYLLFAHGINSRGEIVGFGVTSAGDVHAFLATPRGREDDSDHEDDSAALASKSVTGPMVLTEDVLKLLRLRLGRLGR